MRASGFKLAKIFGIEIFIDYSWLVIFLLVLWIFTVSYYPTLYPEFSPTTHVILGFFTSILFFSSALIHEMAHSLVSMKNNVEVRRITLFLFGGVSELFDEPADPKSEFKIATAGPLTSVVLAIIFYLLFLLFKNEFNFLSGSALAQTLFQANLLLAIFNLLPGFPLDGGRIMRSILWYFTKNIEKATRTASKGGQLVALILIALGVFQIIMSGFFSGIWMIFIGLFLNQAANQSYLELLINNALKEEKVSKMMRGKIVTVSPQLAINELLSEYFLKYKAASFPVAKNNEIVGLISLKDIRKKSSEELVNSRVLQLMKRFPHHLSVNENDRAINALKLMLKEDTTFVPVKDEAGNLKGLITLEDIADYLAEKKIV